jgi:spindle assembly abnormal protein 6
MSINSSPFHTQSQNNYKQNIFFQDFRYQEQPKEIFNNNNNNNQMINSVNLYNQYHSPLSISKEELNSQIFPINKEKRTEIELNMVIVKSEKNTSIEPMKISIIKLFEKQPHLIIQVTNPNDPLFLYSLDLSEIEYQQLKTEQSLLVDFQNFPDFITKMFFYCKNDKDDIYTCVLTLGGIGENNFSSGGAGVLSVEEKTQYRKLNHLILKLQAANDITLKKYLSDVSKEYKEKFENLSQKYADLNQNYELMQKENGNLKENLQKIEYEHKTSLDNLINEKNKEINSIKENNFKETKKQLEAMESDKNKTIADLENRISQLQGILDDATKNKTQLEEHKLKLEINQKDLEGKFAISNTELNVYKTEITNLRQENADLNKKCLNYEKNLTEYNFKNESILKQLEEKNKSLENMKQLIDSLNKQRDSNEDTIKSLKASNSKLENKLQLSIKEINKGNDIIQRLQNDIKNQKSKIKSSKNELNTQEQLINQKQILLDEQNKTIKDLKRDNEAKEQEIIGLKNQINNYNNKLNENEKLIEENKQMILYLNKNLNENSKNPFKSRFNNYTSLDANNINTSPMNNGSFGLGNNNLNTMNVKSNHLETNTNLNINNLNTFNNNNNEQEQNFGIHSQLSNKQMGNNYLQNSLSSNASGMIMPETNFTGYKFNDKIGGSIGNKYLNNTNNAGLGLGSGGSLLAHKYGTSTNSMSIHNNENNVNENFGMSAKNADFNKNLEEEYPRTLAQPQSQIIRK